MRLRQGDDLGPGVLPILPDRLAPAANHGVALGTGRGGKDVGDADGRTPRRNGRRDPLPPILRKLHVRALHLAPGEVFFEKEIQSDQSEDDGDGLAAVPCMLHRVGVDDVLVDELLIAELEGVESQLGVEILIGRR